MNVKTVTVLGANGSMGKNVSAIFASFGDAKVYMMCRDLQRAEKAKLDAAKTVRAGVVAENLIPVTYDDMKEAVSESDLIFESVTEDYNVKNEVNQNVLPYLKDDAIICSGTSGLSINKLAERLPGNVANRYTGMHFFNPPYSMTLCELIPSMAMEQETINEICAYLKDTLYRTVAVVKDEAAFLGNRIGFFFINEALQYAAVYKEKGGIAYIDSVLGPFTGRNMPPIVTADFVGLDVHKAIVDNVWYNSTDCSLDSFKLPWYVGELISKGKLGRKSGEGLYKTIKKDDGTKESFVYDLVDDQYKPKSSGKCESVEKVVEALRNGDYYSAAEEIRNGNNEELKLARDFLVRYLVYALHTAKSVAYDLSAADDVMATGFNWIPPLAVIDALGGKAYIKELVQECNLNHINLSQQEIDDLIVKAPVSKYDYRTFLKAKY